MKHRVVLSLLAGLAAALGVASSITGLMQVSSPNPSVMFTLNELFYPLTLQNVLPEGDDEKMIDVSRNLWDSSKLIPSWMKEYFAWHREVRAQLNETNWKDYRYLVMRCLNVDGKCGGASDRIRSVPTFIRLAAQTNRLFLIRWERPANVEEFLVPPQGGLDWRVPEWMDLNMGKAPVIMQMRTHTIQRCNGTQQVISSIYQSYNHGAPYYDAQRLEGEASFDEVYHDCWSVLFEPSKPVAALIAEHQEALALSPNQYVSVHIRALYVNNKAENLKMVENAINCASQLQPGSPIFVASDSVTVTKYAVEYGARVGGQVLVRRGDAHPLHLDRGSSFLSRPASHANHRREPSAYYDVFVDLYLLASGRCTTYGVGGYGRWSKLISVHGNCFKAHNKERCTWKGGS